MSNDIKTGDIVRFAVAIESCDENTCFIVIDDYAQTATDARFAQYATCQYLQHMCTSRRI